MNNKITVAIADDNAMICTLLAKCVESDSELELVGRAKNGEEIIEIIREKKPDVVLVDIIMPKIDGLTVMENVNNDLFIEKKPKFIVISAVDLESIVEDAFALGAYYYVQKPFDSAIVINKIKESVATNINKNKHNINK